MAYQLRGDIMNEKAKIVKHANTAFMNGDTLTDADLNLLIRHYKQLDDSLAPLGAEFFLARKEAVSRLELLEGWERARKERG